MALNTEIQSRIANFSISVAYRRFVILCCAVLLSIVFAGELAFANGPYKRFKEWSVGCTAALVCSLQAYLPYNENAKAGEDLVQYLEFRRGTMADAPLELVIGLKGSPNEETDLLIKIPGQLEEYYLPFQEGDVVDGSWKFTPSDIIAKLLPAMKKGERLEISVETNEGDGTTKFPLAGVTASLIFLDEAQGRVDHADALQAKGKLPAQDIKTRVSDIASQNDLPKPVLELWANKYYDCNVEDEDVPAKYGGMKIAFATGGAMYLLPCNLPGAYNVPYMAILHLEEEDVARAVTFPVLGAHGPTVLDNAYNLSWNDKTSQLSAFFKGRGIGDCGSQHIWKWPGDEAWGEFTLIEARVKDDCDGKDTKFQLIWPPD